MLQSYPTKNGTGLSIFGHSGDLNILHDTIHHFANTLDDDKNPQKSQFQLLMNFAYEVRKASSGQRLADKYINGYFFVSRAMGADWVKKGNLASEKKIYEIISLTRIKKRYLKC